MAVNQTIARKSIHIANRLIHHLSHHIIRHVTRRTARQSSRRMAWLAGAACMALAGCAGIQGMTGKPGMPDTGRTAATGYDGGRNSAAGMADTGRTSGAGTVGGIDGCIGAASHATRPGEAAPCPPGRQGMAMQSLRGVVQQIEMVTGKEMNIAASGALGAAAAGGSIPDTGSPGGYRVTLRTDDGSVQSVIVGTRPDCDVGDRVTYSNGSISRQ